MSLIAAAFSSTLALQRIVNDDDVRTLHAIWLFAHGDVPYREFLYYRPPFSLMCLSPLAWITSSPTTLFHGGRSIIALAAGASLFVVGRILRPPAHWTWLLGVVWLFFLRGTAFYIFRIEYITVPLCALHLLLLIDQGRVTTRPSRHFLAGMTLGLAGTISIRPLALLPAQPLGILLGGQHGGRAKALAAWLGGLCIGAAPAWIYLWVHDLWAEALFWCFRFGTSAQVVHWGSTLSAVELLVPAAGLLGLLVLSRMKPSSGWPSAVIWPAFAATTIFHVVNPHRGSFTSVHLYWIVSMILAMAWIRGVEGWRAIQSARARRLTIGFGGSVLLVVGMALVALAKQPLRFDRAYQRRQLEALEWLHAVAGGQRVVLVAPNHPMGDRDATRLYDSFQYLYWPEIAAVKADLAGFADSLIQNRPAVVCADPWSGGKHATLGEWAQDHQIVTAAEATRMERWLAEGYERIALPGLEGTDYGSVFWVRRDRLGAARNPGR